MRSRPRGIARRRQILAKAILVQDFSKKEMCQLLRCAKNTLEMNLETLQRQGYLVLTSERSGWGKWHTTWDVTAAGRKWLEEQRFLSTQIPPDIEGQRLMFPEET